MYQDVREAIKTYFNALTGHAFYTATGGRLAYRRAPSSWVDNYAIFHLYDFEDESTFDATIERGVFGVNCWSSTAEGSDDMAAACVSMFNKNLIAVSGGNPFMPQNGTCDPAEPVEDDENELWLAAVEFNIRIQR